MNPRARQVTWKIVPSCIDGRRPANSSRGSFEGPLPRQSPSPERVRGGIEADLAIAADGRAAFTTAARLPGGQDGGPILLGVPPDPKAVPSLRLQTTLELTEA